MNRPDPDAVDCPSCGYLLLTNLGLCTKCGDDSVLGERERRSWDLAIEAGILEDLPPDTVGFRSDACGLEAIVWIRDALHHRIRTLEERGASGADHFVALDLGDAHKGGADLEVIADGEEARLSTDPDAAAQKGGAE